MRILAVQDTDWLERGPTQQHHLLERLSRHGHAVRVLDYPLLWRRGKVWGNPARRQYFPRVAKVLPDSKVELIRPAIMPVPLLDFASHLVGMAAEIERQCQEFQPDLILGYGILSDWGALRAARRHGVPYVSHLLDALHQLIEPPLFRPLGRLIEAYNLRRADCVIVVNKALRDYAVSLGARPEVVKVVPSGIDFERFQPMCEQEALREQLGIRPEQIVIFFMGWLYRFSGVLEMADQLVQLGTEGDCFRFLIVGEGDILHDLLRLRDTNPNGRRLIVAGKQPYTRIPDYLAVADICVLPANNNATMRHIVPMKVYEYLAAGKPVLSTELPGMVAEFGRAGGVYFIQDRSTFLTEARRLLETVGKEELKRLALESVAGREWRALTEHFEAVLQETVESHRNGHPRHFAGVVKAEPERSRAQERAEYVAAP